MAMPHLVRDLSRHEPFASRADYHVFIWPMELGELEPGQASAQLLALITYLVSYYYNDSNFSIRGEFLSIYSNN